MRVIDVAHPPRHPERVEEDLLATLADARNTPGLRVLKIIHGYGSSGSGGSTKEIVRNWLFRRKGIRAVIEGERYGLLDPDTQKLRQEIGTEPDPDLDAGNSGITIVWMR